MNRKQEFETLLRNVASTPVGFAGGKSSSSTKKSKVSKQRTGKKSARRASVKADLSDLDDTVSDEVILKELRRAQERQKRNPSLFSGDPEGFFTYEDPVLAITAYLYQSHLLMSSALGMAGHQGEDLRNESYWKWAKTAIHMWLSRNDEAYKTLMGMTPQETIKVDGEVMRIAVTGDAGFSGQPQSNVIDMIREKHRTLPFDCLIHLGDIYFAGSGGEMLKNFLGPFRKAGPPLYTLVGNHDLYFGGEPFIAALDDLRQPGRYFAVENPHWRVACLDTALPAETVRRNSGLIDKGQLEWLDRQLALNDRKATVLMSHHYIVSGWENSSTGLKRQLALRLNKIFAWYWGHEHSCATYTKKAAGFNGACVGNGAFLEIKKAPSRKPAPEWYAKGQCTCIDDQSNFWPHGYLELELRPDQIVEHYHLEGGEYHTRTLMRP